MCYSAMVEQSLPRLVRRFDAQVDFDQVERTFRQRLQYPKAFQISRAFEFNFDNPRTDVETRIKSAIDEYRTSRGAEIEAKLFEQKTRLNEAERSIKEAEAAGKAPTKLALKDQRIATDKIESCLRWKSDLWRTELKDRDGRIFDNHFVPIIVQKNGARLIQLGRYHLRRRGKLPSFDNQYRGLYNARRDNLEKFWTPEFGKTHALMYIESFFETSNATGNRRLRTSHLEMDVK